MFQINLKLLILPFKLFNLRLKILFKFLSYLDFELRPNLLFEPRFDPLFLSFNLNPMRLI
jgi:hypothetical protein